MKSIREAVIVITRSVRLEKAEGTFWGKGFDNTADLLSVVSICKSMQGVSYLILKRVDFHECKARYILKIATERFENAIHPPPYFTVLLMKAAEFFNQLLQTVRLGHCRLAVSDVFLS